MSLRLVRDDDRYDDGDDGSQLVEEFTAWMRARGTAPATQRVRRMTITSLMRQARVSDPRQLTRRDVVTFLGRDLAAWTRLTYWTSLRVWQRWMIEFGHDPDCNLLQGIEKPRTPAPVARPVDDETVQRLLRAKLPARTRAYVLLALYQALRVHEIAKLQPEDFDLVNGWMTVTGKGGVTKPIPLHPEVIALAETMPEMGWWFPSPRAPGEHVSPTAVSTTIRNALAQVGSTATAHQLRDTAATQLQRRYGDIRLTQTMLRHASPATTAKYAAVTDERLRDAMASLDWQTGPR